MSTTDRNRRYRVVWRRGETGKRKFIGIVRDITDRKQGRDELRIAKEDAEIAKAIAPFGQVESDLNRKYGGMASGCR